MFLKKTTEGGFINESYEKFNRIAGVVALVLIFAAFLYLLILLFLSQSRPFEPFDSPWMH